MTQLLISNLALKHLGMKGIASLTPPSTGVDPSIDLCNSYFEICRDDVFREFRWPFATAQATLNASSVEVPQGWLFAYDYPTQNAATVWTVFNEATSDDKESQDFEVFYDPTSDTKIIGSKLEDAWMEYTHIVTNISLWDNKFIWALSYKLAAAMAHSLTGDEAKGTTLTAFFNGIINDAKRIAATEQKKQPKRKSEYQNSRG